MSDDKSKASGHERERIDVQEDHELRESLHTTPERLKEAVQAVGDRIVAVRGFLGQGASLEH